MAIQKLRFMDAFTEDKKNEVLTLQVKLKVGDQTLDTGTSLNKGEKVGGVDFHIFRYLDLGVETLQDGSYELKGFFPRN